MPITKLNPPPIHVDASDHSFKKWFNDVYMWSDGGVLVPTSSVRPAYPSNRNFIVNGDFQVWQRGTTFTVGAVAKVYTADRWCQSRGSVAGSTCTQGSLSTVSGVLPPEFSFYARVQRTVGDTNTSDIGIAQAIESNNARILRGRTVVLSFWARKGSGFLSESGSGFNTSSLMARVFTGTGTDENIHTGMTGRANAVTMRPVLTTNWQYFQIPTTLATNTNEISVLFTYRLPANATAVANEYFDITGVQLEIATDENFPKATAFDWQPFDITIARCRRYYQKSFQYATAPAQAAGSAGCIVYPCMIAGASNNVGTTQTMSPAMRSSPTVTFYNPQAANAFTYNFTRSTSATATVANGTGQSGFAPASTGIVGWVVGDLLGVQWSADAEI